MDTRTSPIPVRLESVRDALRAQGVAALLVPSSDPHLSEYLPERWQGRVWLSGFTGSMGTLVVTTEHAALFADSRYWTQAEHELRGSGVELVKIPTGAATHHIEWIVANVGQGRHARRRWPGARPGRRAAVEEPRSTPPASRCAPTATCLPAPGTTAPACRRRASMRTSRRTPRRRARPSWPRCARAWSKHGATHHFVSTVDDVAWITNLRGADVDYNPVFLAHLLIDATTGHAVRQRRQDRCGAGQGTGGRRHHAGRLRRRGEGARCVARRRHAAGRSEAHHAGLPRAGAGRGEGGRSDQPEHAGQEPQDGRRSRAHPRGDDRRRRGDVPLLCLVRRRPGARRAHHRNHDRREALRRACQAQRLRRPVVPGDRRLQRQRRDAALPRDAKTRTPKSKATACC